MHEPLGEDTGKQDVPPVVPHRIQLGVQAQQTTREFECIGGQITSFLLHERKLSVDAKRGEGDLEMACTLEKTSEESERYSSILAFSFSFLASRAS
jgi:hypothetical protein